MSREAPWFKFYAARWLGDRNIRYMTPEQRGYLIQLWCESWESDPAGTVPGDPEMLWKLAGAASRKRFERVCAAVLATFELRDGRYFCAELIEQHEGLAAIHESRTRAAMAGAQARWSNRKKLPTALPNADCTHAKGNAYQNKEEKDLTWPGNLRQLENVIRRAVSIAATPTGAIDDKDIDRAIKFDAAYHLKGTDIVTRLRALFSDGAVEDTPFTRDNVDRILVEVFESEVGRPKAMELLQIGRQAYDTLKGKTRRRAKRVGQSGEVQPAK